MRVKKIIGSLLTAFLLLSVGVAVGKEMALRNAPVAAEATGISGKENVIVYYMHGLPCLDCTRIETTTQTLIEQEFSDALRSGLLEFLSLNYLDQENWGLADKYKVGVNMVIAVRFEDGKEVRQERMDQVMELLPQPEKLKDYLRTGIRAALEGAGT